MKRNIALLSLAAAGLIGRTLAANAAASTPDYIYVETNIKTPNGNSIAAFSRAANGELSPLQGSPFLTGGAGTQYSGFSVGPQDSDQNIVVSQDHSLLFAVNSGSDTIAVFHVKRNGSLTPVAGSPFPSGGNDPVSVALVDSTLFVVNKSGDFGRPSNILPNYTTFYVQSDGSLVPSGEKANDSSHSFQSTVSVAIGSSPSQALAVPGTNLLFGADFLSGLIQTFQFRWNGGLKQLPPLALPDSEFAGSPAPRLPLGLWFHPSLPILYAGFVTASKLGVYRYDYSGNLKFLRTVPNAGAAVCWIRTNRAATRLYTSNTVSNSISVYDLANPEAPLQIQEFPIADIGEVLQFTLSTDERTLYALSSRGDASTPDGQGNELHTLNVKQDGTVAETVTPVYFHLPTGTRPQGVAVVPAR